MAISEQLHDTLSQLAKELKSRGWMLATAESCTGGLIAAACTDLPGSSEWFDRGFVTYSNAAKTEMLGVPAELIERHGAVSEEVVRAMAQGAIAHSKAEASIAVSGVAGPGGGTPDKPVGTVWMAWCICGHLHSQSVRFSGERAAVRQQTVLLGMRKLLQALDTSVA